MVNKLKSTYSWLVRANTFTNEDLSCFVGNIKPIEGIKLVTEPEYEWVDNLVDSLEGGNNEPVQL